MLNVCFVTDNEIAVVTDKSVCLWRWETGDKPCSIINAQDVLKKGPHNVTQSNEKAVNTSAVEPYVMQNVVPHEIDHSTYGSYTCATLSQDHQYIIVGDSESCIRVWDVEECRLVKEYLNHNGFVIFPCFYCCDNRIVRFITTETKTLENLTVPFAYHLHSLFPEDPCKCQPYICLFRGNFLRVSSPKFHIYFLSLFLLIQMPIQVCGLICFTINNTIGPVQIMCRFQNPS
jgi:WD40 repeat protein